MFAKDMTGCWSVFPAQVTARQMLKGWRFEATKSEDERKIGKPKTRNKECHHYDMHTIVTMYHAWAQL